MRLDDLEKERVAFIDVEEFLRKESPYLLFYQVQPIEGDPGNISDSPRPGDLDGPPSYAESEKRYSGVIDRSLSSYDGFALNGNSHLSGRPSQDEAASREAQPRSSGTAKRPDSILVAQPAAKSDHALNRPHSPMRSKAAELSLPPVPHGDARGRPAHRNSTSGLSRSLSRFAGKLKKDRGDEMVSRTGAVSRGREASAARTGSSETFVETEARKDLKDMDSFGMGNVSVNEHVEYADVAKDKQKAHKPERQCVIM